MRYVSTRASQGSLSFQDAVLSGLAPDGGLYVPSSIPNVREHLDIWKTYDYVTLAEHIMALFIDDIERSKLRQLIQQAYKSFSKSSVVDIKHLPKTNIHVLELFHGPTLAFKDVALQFLAQVFEHILEERKSTMNVLGATSGDTGSAAISALQGHNNISVFMMYPHNKVSPMQALQMTTNASSNVHCLAVNGNFDDCQRILKSISQDNNTKNTLRLGAVNSINWARILAQVVYYFYSYFQLQTDKEVVFSVPTGNFGDILAGHYARSMGLPIKTLIAATNQNDILPKFFQTGIYERESTKESLSPAMDIQAPSNFERLLFDATNREAEALTKSMQTFMDKGKCQFDLQHHAFSAFTSYSISDQETLDTINKIYSDENYLIDPHTAVGVAAATQYHKDTQHPIICLSTAHPAKFPETIIRTLPNCTPTHQSLNALVGKTKYYTLMENSIDDIKEFLKKNAI